MNKVRKYYRKFRFHCWLRRNLNVLNIPQEGKRCFVFLAANYGNLGDVAITYAQEKWLSEELAGYHIVDVPISDTVISIGQIKKTIRPNDIITVVGGGNMSDLYFDIELLRLLVVKSFPKNKILLFPQTIQYNETKEGKTLLNLAKKIYPRHKNLVMMAREKTSFVKMQEYFPAVNVKMLPDIVMTLSDLFSPINWRNGVIFCLRNDKEKGDTEPAIKLLRAYFEEKDIPVINRDTHIGSTGLSIEQRKVELENIWSDFSKSRVVITDRLHGMIFGFITGTPTLVLPNNNFKIQGCYEWIKDCGYIYFYDSHKPEDIEHIIRSKPDRNVFWEINARLKQAFACNQQH